MNFNKIIGHEEVVNNLKYMVENDIINHGIMFEGINGIGKKHVATIFAKSILCEINHGPCNECDKCIQFDNNTNPDFMIIKNEDKSIKKSEIVGLIEFLSIKPFNSKYKVAIIEDFHKATPEAQNSFLKTLEEGPSYGIVILLSENSKNILETVMSRVKLYKFSPISKYKIAEYLIENFDIDEEEAYFYGNYANGSIGRGIKLATDEEFRSSRDEYINIFDRALKGQSDYVFSNLEIFKDKENLEDILDLYLIWLRDLLLLIKTNKIKYIYNIDYEETLNSETHLSLENIERIKKLIINLKSNLKYSINKDLAVELFFINVLEECEWQKQ